MGPTCSSVGNLTNWDGARIINKVMTCVVDACSQHNLSTCPEVTQNLLQISPTVDNLPKILSGLDGFCSKVGLKVNYDIAGPGVMVLFIADFGCLVLLDAPDLVASTSFMAFLPVFVLDTKEQATTHRSRFRPPISCHRPMTKSHLCPGAEDQHGCKPTISRTA